MKILQNLTPTQRDILGDILTFLLATVINILAFIAVYYVEAKQAKNGNFPLEEDDIARRALWVILGAGLNIFILTSIINQ